MKPKKGKDPLVKSFSAAIAGKLTQIYMFFHTLNPKEIVMKKIVNAFLIAATCLSLCVPAMAIETNSVTTDDCVIISQEEYLQNYADYYGITYEEAFLIDREENSRIWLDYIARNTLPVPYTLIYDSYYEQADARIYYVTASNVANATLVKVTYSAFGKIVVDQQGRSFVPGSFGEPRASTNNVFF